MHVIRVALIPENLAASVFKFCFKQRKISFLHNKCWVKFLAGQVQEDDVVDSKILAYCSIDKKEKKTLGEMEQEFLQALQVDFVLYYSYTFIFYFISYLP